MHRGSAESSNLVGFSLVAGLCQWGSQARCSQREGPGSFCLCPWSQRLTARHPRISQASRAVQLGWDQLRPLASMSTWTSSLKEEGDLNLDLKEGPVPRGLGTGRMNARSQGDTPGRDDLGAPDERLGFI